MGQTMPKVNVAVVVGSNRRDSINRKLAQALSRLAPPELEMSEISFKDLPIYSYDYDANYPPAGKAFKDAIAAVDAVLFVTPEHNRSIPAAIKNAIDWGSRPPGHNNWVGKPSGIVGISPGTSGTAMAQQHLRNILAAEGSPALTTPEVFLQMKDGLFGPDHTIANPDTRKFLQGWVDRYVAWVEKLAQ